MHRMFKLGLAACGLAVAGVAASAELVTATDPAIVLNAARGYGAATLERDSVGDPKISGRIDGTRYTVFFYGCTDGAQCVDIQFVAGWTGRQIALEDINGWNRRKRYGTAYIDDAGDAGLKMDVNLNQGVSPANLDDSFDWWKAVLKGFEKDVIGR